MGLLERAQRMVEGKITIVQDGDHLALARCVMRELGELPAGPELVHAEGSLWRWDGKRWDDIPHELVERAVCALPDLVVLEGGAAGRDLKMTNNLHVSVTKLIRKSRGVPHFFEGETGMAFDNGYLPTEAGQTELLPHDPKTQRTRHLFEFDFVPGAECPRWLAFLEDVWRDDEDRGDKIQCLREFMGACLIGWAPEAGKALLLLGTGANGKSVLCEIMEAVFPASSVVAVPPQVMDQPTRLATLAGARLNLVSDLPTKNMLDTGAFKQVLTGDLIEARRLYEAPFGFRPRCGHVFSANALPRTKDTTPGFFRRWLVLEFNRKFQGEAVIPRDVLVAQILKELPGIVVWALGGAVEAKERHGILEPRSSKTALTEWAQNQDQVAAFVDEMLEPTTSVSEGLPAREVYHLYCGWAEEAGHARMAQNQFGARMKAIGLEKKRGGRGNIYLVTLKPKG